MDANGSWPVREQTATCHEIFVNCPLAGLRSGYRWVMTRPVDTVHKEIDNKVRHLFALVAEGVTAATDALLAGDRETASMVVARDSQIDALYVELEELVQRQFVLQATFGTELRYLISVMRIVPELERSGDLVEHIASRAARGLGSELSPRMRGLIQRMGTVANDLWKGSAIVFTTRDLDEAELLRIRDDQLDELHVQLTAEIIGSQMPVQVAIEMALVARFYERLGDHAVNIANRIRYVAAGLNVHDHPGPQ